jgi:hypothetical protein
MTGWPSLAMSAIAAVRSATFESMTVFATRLAYFSCFSCSTGSPQPQHPEDLKQNSGRASREIVGEITKRARAAQPVAL